MVSLDIQFIFCLLWSVDWPCNNIRVVGLIQLIVQLSSFQDPDCLFAWPRFIFLNWSSDKNQQLISTFNKCKLVDHIIEFINTKKAIVSQCLFRLVMITMIVRKRHIYLSQCNIMTNSWTKCWQIRMYWNLELEQGIPATDIPLTFTQSHANNLENRRAETSLKN